MRIWLMTGAVALALALTAFWVFRPQPVPERFRAGNPGDSVPTPRTDRFDQRHAFSLLSRQVRVYGHRPAGSSASRALARDLASRLPGGRLEPLSSDPRLANVTGVIPGRKPAILLAAHYDTEARPSDFVGANDGAAGTAAVLALARALSEQKVRGGREIRFALFDGEEEPAGSKDFYRDGLRGSRNYLSRHRDEVGQVILLDYVANRGLRLPRESSSDPRLWARLRAAARRAATIQSFPPGTVPTVIDDHTPFLEAGIPSINLIDFEYPWRDTSEDDLSKVSIRSLDVTGETVFQLVSELRRR